MCERDREIEREMGEIVTKFIIGTHIPQMRICTRAKLLSHRQHLDRNRELSYDPSGTRKKKQVTVAICTKKWHDTIMYPVLRVAIGVVESKGLDDVSMLTECSHMERSRSNLTT